MKLWFEDDLVESVVFLIASGKRAGVPALQIRRFYSERERCYATPDPDERAAAFARVQLAWFTEWGMGTWLRSVADRFSPLDGLLATLAFRKARGGNDEGAELYRNAEGAWQGIVALKPDRFADDTTLERFLHHELTHVADMVDETFGYSPDLDRPGQPVSHQRLVCERYRLLWNISVDGRLTQRGLSTVADEGRRRREFDRGFGFLTDARREEVFADLWNGRHARHDDLLAIAADPRGVHEHHAAVPGAPCPLCAFASFQWAEVGTLRPEVRDRIRAEFPRWDETKGLCARCAEIYDSIGGIDYPATVCV